MDGQRVRRQKLDRTFWFGGGIFDAEDEDRSSLADVCAELIELMVFDRFLEGHALGFQFGDDLVVVVGDDRFAAERFADANDAIIEAVHEQKLLVILGQKFSDSSHGLALLFSSVG